MLMACSSQTLTPTQSWELSVKWRPETGRANLLVTSQAGQMVTFKQITALAAVLDETRASLPSVNLQSFLVLTAFCFLSSVIVCLLTKI